MLARNGIIAAGNWIIDIVKIIDNFPAQESLSNILEESKSNGGSPYNVLKGLSNMQAPFDLEALGLVGYDGQGNFIMEDCENHNINTSQLYRTHEKPTSYTDVMTVKSDGKRTFFHNRGANALLNESHFSLEVSKARIFHLGYMLLLDNLDEIDKDGTTGASRVFKRAKELGFITTTDLVSENSDRFTTVIPPSLPYIDYLFVNEFEAEKITGIHTSKDGVVDLAKCKEAAEKLLKMGVQQWVILHFPHGAIAISKQATFHTQGSLKLPIEKIAGSVGAGDAFAAGVLMGIHEKFGMSDSLKLGICAAASSLFHPSCSEGVLPWKECLKLAEQYDFREI
jgi:sugar/nucleoside kinase (ribokinase family)